MDSPRHPGSFLPLPDAELEILIALADGEAHGYAIMRAVAERTEGRRRLGPGTLYTALKRLLAARLIEEVAASRGAGGEEARRRLYRLSHFGSRVLAAELDRLSSLVRYGRRRLHLLPSEGGREAGFAGGVALVRVGVCAPAAGLSGVLPRGVRWRDGPAVLGLLPG
jgi:DNA-binding PadR family transcriptional regulator